MDLSPRASVSSQSRLRSAKAKRRIAEYKLKRLTAKHALERAHKELELKQQLYEQQCEVEEATPKESVWQLGVKEETAKATEPKNVYIPSITSHIRGSARDPVSLKSGTDIRPISTVSTQTQTRVRSQSPKRNDQGVFYELSALNNFGC